MRGERWSGASLQDAEGGQASASKAAEEKEASILRIERTMKMLRCAASPHSHAQHRPYAEV